MLSGVRVLDRTTGIAGPYCTKVLADAGADVVKVEPPEGDPMRRWKSGALFEFLNTSKRSVLEGDALIAGADILVLDGPVDVAPLRAAHPSLVIVTISPFGCDGPWADRPATEFTLQAVCGSDGHRGLPENPPIAAGGRIGEWVTGTYAAIGALAAFREAQRSGHGDHVDVSILDCMAVTMATYPSVFAEFAGWPPVQGTGRMIEVPSIEPTADGYAVFTTNSAQQFQDFLVMIGRADLLEDTELASSPTRFARRNEFLAAVHDYTTKRGTEELLEEAGAFRIPAGPVLNGATVPDFEQFAVRGVFVKSPSGRFRQPRPPFRVEGAPARPFEPAPEVGADTVTWEPRARTASADWKLPLEGVRILDLTAWWAGPAALHVLAALGADVIKIESQARPDLMRFSSVKPASEPQWWEWGPLFQAVNAGKRGVTIDLTRPEGREAFEDLVRTSDVVIENYTPRVMDQFGLGWDRLHEINPELTMVRMPAFGLDGPWRERGGFAQTMESITGMAWLTGFEDGPPVLVRGACDPISGMHAVIATLLALQTGGGTLVESVMVEAALQAAAEQVIEYDASGELLTREGNRGPVAAPQGLYRCAGEDAWLAIAVADDDQWAALGRALGNPAWHADPALATDAGRRAAHDAIDAELSAYCAGRDATVLAEQLMTAGVPAGAVIRPRDVALNPQLRWRGLFEVSDHPVSGRREMPSMPFRFTRVDEWLHRPAPTLGQHNDEILGGVIGADALQRLRDLGVTGEKLGG